MAVVTDPADAARKAAAKEALQKPTMSPEEQALADEAARKEAHPDPEPIEAQPEPTGLELPKGWVRARVLRKGHNKIFTGQIDGTNPDPEGKFTKFPFGAVIPMEGHVALAQEENGHVEVLGPYRRMLGLPEED